MPADPSPATSLFDDKLWQMALGERAALEGILASARPRLAIEIGTAQGACLQRIAQHAAEVHSFDLVLPQEDVELPGHVHLHTGDSHALLRPFLDALVAAGRTVDFVLVDGDHSAAGVHRDLTDLLQSGALRNAIVAIHDTSNAEVRSGVDAVDFGAFPDIAHVELDFVPGQLGQDAFTGQVWGGLGLILVGDWSAGHFSGARPSTYYVHHGQVLEVARRELAPPA